MDCSIGSCRRHGKCMYTPCRSTQAVDRALREVPAWPGNPADWALETKTDGADHSATHEAQRRLYEVQVGGRRSGKMLAVQQATDRLLDGGQDVVIVGVHRPTRVLRSAEWHLARTDPCDEWPAHLFGWVPAVSVRPTPITAEELS